jgi:hypothetical protein
MGVPVPIDSWLARGIQAYRIGEAVRVTMSDGPSGELFRSRGQSHIRSRLDDAAHQHYIAVRDGARAAVAAARTGDFAESERQFTGAETYLASVLPGRELLMLSRSWIDQAYAYLAVRKRDWPAAQSRLTSAMQADLALEEEFDYQIFHIGRVHTLHLWLRAEGEAGNRAGAVALAQQIVDYVQGRSDSLPIGSGWSRARAAAVPADLKTAMLLRISSEAATQISLAPRDDAAAVFAGFQAWHEWAADPILSEVHEWASAKVAWLAGDTRAFLERAESILAKGRRETTTWYATALDFCRVCEAIRPAATAPFREDVRADVAMWRHLPADVQSPGLFAVMARPPEADRGNGYSHRPAARRFRAFTVGLPRTGSTSLYTLFTNFRAGNEFMEQQTIARVVQRHNGGFSAAELEQYLRRRDDEGDLEMDSASFHHLYLEFLRDEYPDARFIMTIRSPYDWANSYIKMIMGWHQRFTAGGQPLPRWMEDYGVMLFGDFSWSWVASPATVAERAEPLATAFIKHWAEANRRTLSLLPADRALVVRTEELSQSCDRIARFAGVAPGALTDQHHSNVHPDRSDLLIGVGRARIESMAREYGADVLAAAGIELAVATP